MGFFPPKSGSAPRGTTSFKGKTAKAKPKAKAKGKPMPPKKSFDDLTGEAIASPAFGALPGTVNQDAPPMLTRKKTPAGPSPALDGLRKAAGC